MTHAMKNADAAQRLQAVRRRYKRRFLPMIALFLLMQSSFWFDIHDLPGGKWLFICAFVGFVLVGIRGSHERTLIGKLEDEVLKETGTPFQKLLARADTERRDG